MNRLVFCLAFLLTSMGCSAQEDAPANELRLGAYQFSKYLPALEGKSVGLLVNHTSTLGDVHLVDTLRSLNVDVVKVFAPEHGFRGTADAGEMVADGVDTATGLPLLSLHGSSKKASADQLADVDVVIFDIQDVGTRFYTYISTMHYMMEACAENNKKMIVLDRPNPNGMYVDGPVMEDEYKSFVGMHPIPILHGLTVGELAKMINGEGWLKGGVQCDLTVIPMANYNHQMIYNLPINPSPNLPNDLSIQLYPSLCLFEATAISVGRGTYEPFQQIGHPSFTDLEYTFTPVSIEGMSKYPRYENETVHGIKFTSENAVKGFDLNWLLKFYEKYENKSEFFSSNFFEKLAGTRKLRDLMIAGKGEQEIRASWAPELEAYKAKRNAYLLYP